MVIFHDNFINASQPTIILRREDHEKWLESVKKELQNLITCSSDFELPSFLP